MFASLTEFLSRLKSLFRKRRLDREMAEELEFHQALMQEKLMRQGLPQSRAAYEVRRTFGNPARWQERLRELWQIRSLENLLRDVRFSLRMLRKSPGFTAVAILTLALGVGANTAVFSLINGLLLRPLPVPHAEKLVVLRMEEGGPNPDYSFITPFFRSLETQHQIFSDVFAYNADTFQIQGESGSDSIHGALVSGQFFSGLQTAPQLGRYLTPMDDRPGGSGDGLAVVISDHFWQLWFNRDPNVVGRKLIIATVPFTVVGVMPKQFIGADPTQNPEIYAPLSADPIIDAPRDHIHAGIHAWWLTVIARLQPGVSLDQANAALVAVSNPILHDATSDASFLAGREKGHFHFAAEPGARGYTYARTIFRKPLVIMFWMCGGILLLACLNLASLLMARSASRERELATRLAMGATRRRLVQQLLVESMLIAILGTALGIAVAPTVSSSLAVMVASGERGMQLDTSLDWRVLAFGALIAIVSTLAIGLIPALQSTGRNVSDQIKEGQHASRQHERRNFTPRLLLTFEVALALVLVVGAGLLATSVLRLYRSGTGFDSKGLVNIAFSMDKQPLEGDALMRLYQQIDEEISHLPGVKNASLEFIVPLSHRGWNNRVSTPGGQPSLIWMNAVAPRYFETMRIPLYMGREFTWSDTKSSGLKIILNQAAAKLFFPGRNALGQQVLDSRTHDSYEVVAIVGDAKYKDIRTPAPAAAYVPIQQDEQAKPSLTAVVRVDGQQAPLVAATRAIAARLAPSIPAPAMTTMDEVVGNSMSAERMLALLTVFFAGCALLVTAIGLYGTLAYSTARRTSEIGIRMALGAQRAGVVGLVFRENAIVAIAGSATGLAAAILASKALASFLYETSPRDPWILFASVSALAAVGSAASLLPAIRAARIEPITAIRCE
jgi:putative ABC transport system permease protein